MKKTPLEISFFDKKTAVEQEQEVEVETEKSNKNNTAKYEYEYKIQKLKLEQDSKLKKTRLGVMMVIAGLIGIYSGVDYSGWVIFFGILML